MRTSTKILVLGVGCQLALLIAIASVAHFTVAAPVTAPTVLLSATSLSYGDETVGATSEAQVVAILNSGDATLTITGTSPSGDYAVDADYTTCTATLAAGASCEVAVTFNPTKIGERAGTLTIADSAADSPQTVTLLGTGVASVASTN